MSARKAKRPRISCARHFSDGAPRVTEVFISDVEVTDDLSPGERLVLKTMRARGRPVHVTDDGGKTSRRVGILAAHTPEGDIAWARSATPLVFTPDQLAARVGQQ